MLKFIEADNFYDGNNTIQLQISGFEIPILKDHPELLSFNVKAYFVFVKFRSTAMAYAPVNHMLESMSIEKQIAITSALVLMNSLLREDATTIDEIDATLNSCSIVLDDLDREINLCDDIEAYVRTGIIPISDMSSAGSRPHDKIDMTFVQEEAIVITSLTILSKLLSPVFGEFLYRHTGIINPQYKESWTCYILTRLLKRKHQTLIKKIDHYISSLVKNKKSRDDAGIHYRGFTHERTSRKLVDDLLTKKFVSIDLSKQDGNVIKYIASCTKSYIESQQRNSNNQSNVKLFLDPKDGDTVTGNEETNSSRVEIESPGSHKPMIGPPVANFAAKWVIKKTLRDENIDKEFYEQSCQFYKQNPVLVTPITLFILATYFGPDIGGGKSIYLLEAPITIRLAVLLQIIAARQGAENIAHLLTMKVSADERLGQATDFTFSNAWKSSAEYVECRRKISSGFGETTWDTKLKDIACTLTSRTFSYHTAPVVWESLKKDNLNGTLFTDPLNFMLELLILIKTLWIKRSNIDDSINSEIATN